MQNHVKLEIALEIITNKIAHITNELKYSKDEGLEKKLTELLEIKEKAYEGDMQTVEQILKMRKENNNGK